MNLSDKIAKRLVATLGAVGQQLNSSVLRQHDHLALMIGKQEANRVSGASYKTIQDAEFRVFSQWGEDGILQYLISKVPIGDTTFVEFGVADYRESNTRFLLCNNNWRGLIIDGGTEHLKTLRRDGLQWRFHIDARSLFITRENINAAIAEAGIHGDIGLLSIDIDGNDYWVLESIDVVRPRILVVEYNATFGSKVTVTIPYDANFDRTTAHYSNLYWGASLAALAHLAQLKGYHFVGCNSAGNNAFFVRSDVSENLEPIAVEDGFMPARFRDSRDRSGKLNYLSDPRSRLEAIKTMPIVDVRTNATLQIADILSSAMPTGLK